ncbi:MAG: NAD(P)H-dependent oxidoreductase subunit E [Candidatus Electryonea clarkiae]|nr:NAD(P)H-dependent oxidoreductase subunit E [Candidatus Electryonea clarkiae]MDP8288280.1 NAD(P)H-dependent oxidoreductase subunit E [Candidatus Electryonea clarkiae]
MAFELTKEKQELVKEVITHYPDPRSAILPAMHIVMDERGWVGDDGCQHVAELLEVPIIYVYEALSFYTYFPKHPVGKYHIQVCHNIACNLRGSEELIEHLVNKHGIIENALTDDGLFYFNRVECLGACGNAPVMQVNDEYYEDLTLEEVDKLIEGFKKSSGNGKNN